MKYQTMFDHFDHNSNSYGTQRMQPPAMTKGPEMENQQEEEQKQEVEEEKVETT